METTEEWSIFEYHIVPYYNLYQQLLWHRERLEVIEPISMRKYMEQLLADMQNLYHREEITGDASS